MSNIKLNAKLRAYSNASIELSALSVEDTKSLFDSVRDSLMSRKTSMPSKGVR